MIELAEHRDVPLQRHPHQALDAKVGFEGAIVEGIDLVARRWIQHQPEVGRLDLVENGDDLALGKFPRLPPEARVGAAFLHRVVEHIEKTGKPLVQRQTAAPRTRPELAA